MSPITFLNPDSEPLFARTRASLAKLSIFPTLSGTVFGPPEQRSFRVHRLPRFPNASARAACFSDFPSVDYFRDCRDARVSWLPFLGIKVLLDPSGSLRVLRLRQRRKSRNRNRSSEWTVAERLAAPVEPSLVGAEIDEKMNHI